MSRKRMGYPPKPGTRHEPPDYYQKLPFEWDYSNLSPEDFPSWVGKIGPILATLPPPPKLSDFVDAYYARQNAKRQEQQQQGQAEQEADMSNQAASTSQVCLNLPTLLVHLCYTNRRDWMLNLCA